MPMLMELTASPRGDGAHAGKLFGALLRLVRRRCRLEDRRVQVFRC